MQNEQTDNERKKALQNFEKISDSQGDKKVNPASELPLSTPMTMLVRSDQRHETFQPMI
ncbi:hypothetical protein FHR92_004825 [Fontibacillus solani]|uniref:Uncharacterized protein n=1 Tax=Fontibacillus solani TaxID=1572857 RepID=A0A7W3SY04_9BACL|nr:hypothetical protein [Fontibacillus solani]MBA9088329.1 hypothetical protein [Fontibacillus solani]